MGRQVSALAGADTLRSTTAPTPGGHNAKVEAAYETASQATAPNVTDKTSVSAHAKAVTYRAVLIIIIALVLLWILGGITFRNANL